MSTMKTEAEFVAERLLAHREACAELDNDLLIKLVTTAHEPVVVSEKERDRYCFPEGWQLRRQAG